MTVLPHCKIYIWGPIFVPVCSRCFQRKSDFNAIPLLFKGSTKYCIAEVYQFSASVITIFMRRNHYWSRFCSRCLQKNFQCKSDSECISAAVQRLKKKLYRSRGVSVLRECNYDIFDAQSLIVGQDFAPDVCKIISNASLN